MPFLINDILLCIEPGKCKIINTNLIPPLSFTIYIIRVLPKPTSLGMCSYAYFFDHISLDACTSSGQ